MKRTLGFLLSASLLLFHSFSFAEELSPESLGLTKTSEAGRKPSATEVRDEIRDVIRSHMQEISQCYVSKRSKPSVEGKFVVQLFVEPSGSPTKVEILESTLKEPKVHQCVADLFKNMKFNSHPEGMQMSIRYPILFASK